MAPRTQCTPFLRWALPRLGMRWAGFRKVRGQVCKRIARRIRELGLDGFEAYRRHLERHPEEWRVLDGLCRVTITRFHRDRGVFELLRGEVLPMLAEAVRASAETEQEGSRRAEETSAKVGKATEEWALPNQESGLPQRKSVILHIWSAGCASGEEPYTLALAERLDPTLSSRGIRLHITATDADPHLLARARRGRYPVGALRDLPAGWVEEAFTPVSVPETNGPDMIDDAAPGGQPAPDRNAEMELSPEIREKVVFLEQDLREEMPGGPFHLILCRNLAFTYFDEAGRRETLGRLADRLVSGGVLVLGAHERLPGEGDAPSVDPAVDPPRFRRIRPGEPVYRLEAHGA